MAVSMISGHRGENHDSQLTQLQNRRGRFNLGCSLNETEMFWDPSQ